MELKVAAYQAPLLPLGSEEALALIYQQVLWCEAEGVSILCCPEAVLGGLADYSVDPSRFAIRTAGAEMDRLLAALASDRVTTILGFTELAQDDQLYNAALVTNSGKVLGIYRKLHPALRRSVYSAGTETPVFAIDGFCFGVLICNDSNFPEPAREMAAKGAKALFIPTNNALPQGKAHPGIVAEARRADSARAKENGVWILRADVAGECDGLLSYGTTAIVAPCGAVVAEAQSMGTATLATVIHVN